MSFPDVPKESAKSHNTVAGWIALAGVLVTLGLLAMALSARLSGQILFQLVAGWWIFLERSFSRLHVDTTGLLVALACLALACLGLHSLCRWVAVSVSNSVSGEARTARPWPLRATISLLGIFILAFAAGICFVGGAHQAAWLASAPQPLTVQRLDLPQGVRAEGLVDIAIGIGNLESAMGPTRSPAIFNSTGHPVHSWQTRLMAYMGYMLGPDFDWDLPWDGEVNAPSFQGLVIQYLRPDVSVTHDERGFGLSHIAASTHAFGRPEMIAPENARLIVFGEAAADFRPWGDPANVRNPLLGINRETGGFGNAARTGATFLMADGSVQFIPNEIDPQVLEALTVPRAAEGDDKQSTAE